jgi:hypothetical protein
VTAVAAAGVFALVLSVAGCSDGPDDPLTAPTAAATSAGPAASATTPGGLARRYDATHLDLCARTDRAPLAGLSLKLSRSEPRPPRSAPGAACLFDLRTTDGHEASLLVEASTLGSAEEAGRLYRATADVTGMTADGAIAGVGEEAEGFAKESDPGFKNSEYLVHARTGNLVVKVWLAVGGKAFTPKQRLADAVLPILKATLAVIPEA